MTCSRILDPVRTKETPYIYSFYDNEEVPWGIADGSIERGGYWASYAGYDTLFSFSQYQSGGRRGMAQWRKGWGGQLSKKLKEFMDPRDLGIGVEPSLAKAQRSYERIEHDPAQWRGKGLSPFVERLMTEGHRIGGDAPEGFCDQEGRDDAQVFS